MMASVLQRSAGIMKTSRFIGKIWKVGVLGWREVCCPRVNSRLNLAVEKGLESCAYFWLRGREQPYKKSGAYCGEIVLYQERDTLMILIMQFE